MVTALYGLAAVLLAALGAHAISFPGEKEASLWHTALELHMFHTAAMLAITALDSQKSASRLAACGLVMALGVLMFSGSLYLRAAGYGFLPGFLTPGGGFVLMAAWIWLAAILARNGVESVK